VVALLALYFEYSVVTHRNILCIGKSDILGDWESDWVINFIVDLKGEPEVKDTRIVFPIHNTVSSQLICLHWTIL